MPLQMQPPVSSGFQGSKYNESFDAGLKGGAPFVQTEQALKQMGEDEDTKAKAIAYRQLLHTGADGMKKYAAEIGSQFPELGQQLAQEADQYGTFLQDPNLDASQAEEYAHHFYDSANNRVKALKQPKPDPAAKPWQPTTQDEAENWYRFKRETDADNKPAPRGTASDRARAEKRMNALRKIPALWKQIDEMQATGGEVPLVPGKAEPDVGAYVKKQAKPWKEKWEKLRADLNKYEADAGLEASTDIMGPGRDSSASYKLYKGQPTSGDDTAPAPVAPRQPRNTIDDAVAWLKDPKNKNAKQRAAILAEVKKAGVDTNGL